MDIESHRTQSCATKRLLRIPNLTDETVEGSCLATVVNAKIIARGSSLNINADYLCPISQLVPDDAIFFGRTLYEQTPADDFIRDSLTTGLPRSYRGERCVKDPLNPSHIIYSCESRGAIKDEAEKLVSLAIL